MRFLLTTGIFLACVIAAFACESKTHEMLEKDQPLSDTFFVNGIRNLFGIIAGIAAVLLFL